MKTTDEIIINKTKGQRANLQYADLRYANLQGTRVALDKNDWNLIAAFEWIVEKWKRKENEKNK